MTKKIKWILIIIFVLLLICVILIFIDSINHNVSDEPAESDMIVILGGGDDGRMIKAAELYHAGYANTIFITAYPSEAQYDEAVEIAREYNIPREAVFIEKDTTSTYTNALKTHSIMEQFNFNSALIVTSDYHITRAELIYERLNENGYDFRYIASKSSDGESWYEREQAVSYWFNEMINMWGYRFGLYKIFDR